MKVIKVVLKVLLFPLYLLLQLLGILIVTFNQFAVIAFKFLGGLFALGVICTIIYSLWKGNPDWVLALQGAIVTGVLFGLRALSENAPYYLSGFAKRLISW